MAEQHTAEPWEVQFSPTRTRPIIFGSDGFGIAGVSRNAFHIDDPDTTEANARRIVACVNACKGIGTDTLESITKFAKHETRLAALSVASRSRSRVYAEAITK